MEFSKIATEMNTKIQNGEQTTVDVELNSGETVNCAIIIVLTVEEKDYIVLLPLDENGQNTDGNVWFYELYFPEGSDEPDLGYIEDDDEYLAVTEAFNLYLDDAEYDELVELPDDLPDEGSEEV